VAGAAPDIRLVQNAIFPRYSVTLDWQLLPNGTLDDTQALATAICIALGTNALADDNDTLPDPDSTNRCGWWGDLDAELIWNGWPIGSKLWLLRRAKITSASARDGSTLVVVENYIRDAVQPFVDRRVCTSFDIVVSRVDAQRIDALVRIYRGPLPAIDLRYAVLWDSLEL
jgi:phage gp46-like protein